jgi:hypothetical protein
MRGQARFVRLYWFTVSAMSEGRLAPVRETDRHASLVAGLVAAACGAATFAALYAVDVRPDLSGYANGSAASFPALVAMAAGFGFVLGCVEGAVAARAARKAAGRFADLSTFARKVFFVSAVANVACVALVVSVAFADSDTVFALACAAVVAVVASGVGSALFGWSHAADWPHVPEYLKKNITPTTRDAQSAPPAERDVVELDTDHTRDSVVNEGRSRRSSKASKPSDDALWTEIDELIKGR